MASSSPSPLRNPGATKRSIAICYDISSSLLAAGVLTCGFKRIRRLPHLFRRFLELPVHADSLVNVLESRSCFTFSVSLPHHSLLLPSDVRAEIVEIAPGVTKVRIAGAHRATAVLDEHDIPLWRFRLPDSSIPESSSAVCDSDGLLTLTIPKVPSSAPSLLESYQVRSPSEDRLLDDLDMSSDTQDVQRDSSIENASFVTTNNRHESSFVTNDATDGREVSDGQNFEYFGSQAASSDVSVLGPK